MLATRNDLIPTTIDLADLNHSDFNEFGSTPEQTSIKAPTNSSRTVIPFHQQIKSFISQYGVSAYRNLENAAVRYPNSFRAIAVTIAGCSLSQLSTKHVTAYSTYILGVALIIHSLNPHYFSISQQNESQQKYVDALNKEFESSEYPEFNKTLLNLITDEDPNGAFSLRFSSHQLRRLRKSIHVFSCLVHKVTDIDKAVSSLKDRNKNIIALIIGTHGDSSGRCYLAGKRVHKVIEKMLQEGIHFRRIFLDSCSTGIPKGEADLISKLPGAEEIEVYGPSIPTCYGIYYTDAQGLPATFNMTDCKSAPKAITNIYQKGQIVSDHRIQKDAPMIIYEAKKDPYAFDRFVPGFLDRPSVYFEYCNAFGRPEFFQLLEEKGLEEFSNRDAYFLIGRCIHENHFQELQKLIHRKDLPHLSSEDLKSLLGWWRFNTNNHNIEICNLLLFEWPFDPLDEEQIAELMGGRNPELTSLLQKLPNGQNIHLICQRPVTSALLTISILGFVLITAMSLYFMSLYLEKSKQE